jgi:hypothetical protein
MNITHSMLPKPEYGVFEKKLKIHHSLETM